LRSFSFQDSIPRSIHNPSIINKYYYKYATNGNLECFLEFSSLVNQSFGQKFNYQPGLSVPFSSTYVSSTDSGETTTPFQNMITTNFLYDSLDRFLMKGYIGSTDTTALVTASYDNFTCNVFPVELTLRTSNIFNIPNYFMIGYSQLGGDPFEFLGMNPGTSEIKTYESNSKCDFNVMKFFNKMKNTDGNLISYRYTSSRKTCNSPEVLIKDRTITITY
jgi:hypothetical protein